MGINLTKITSKTLKNGEIIYAVNFIAVNKDMSETETNTNQQQTLSIVDIALVKQIIEVANSRGAFRADELAQIGTVYNRISLWLAAVQETVSDEAEEPTEGETDA